MSLSTLSFIFHFKFFLISLINLFPVRICCNFSTFSHESRFLLLEMHYFVNEKKRSTLLDDAGVLSMNFAILLNLGKIFSNFSKNRNGRFCICSGF